MLIWIALNYCILAKTILQVQLPAGTLRLLQKVIQEEIALSILAEIKALFAGNDVQSLRTINEVIHPRSATTIEEVKLTSKS